MVKVLEYALQLQPSAMDSDGAIDDTTSSAFSSNKQHAQLFLTIPANMILDQMLEQLGLPVAKYRHRLCEDHKTCVTVLFHTSPRSSPRTLIPMAIYGLRSMDVARALLSAATEAIRYLENMSNTVVKDLNYRRLKQLENENVYLRNKLKEAYLKANKLSRGWFLSVRHMRSYSEQFHNMAILSYFGGQEVIADSMKAAFANIERLSQRLKYRSNRLENKLKETRSVL